MVIIILISFFILILILILIGFIYYKNKAPIGRTGRTFGKSIPGTIGELIKEQTISGNKETILEGFENTNITIPNKKLLELYNKVLTLAPEVLLKKINCDSATLQTDYMYNVCECLISKLRVYSSGQDNTQISPEQFNKLIAILSWIRFMIENNISDVGEIFKYSNQDESIQGESIQDESIKIIHPNFKDFLNKNFEKLKDPKTSIVQYNYGGKELNEKLEEGLANNIISINDYIMILLQYSDSIGGQSIVQEYEKNCDCKQSTIESESPVNIQPSTTERPVNI
jgi:hypothetical protein